MGETANVEASADLKGPPGVKVGEKLLSTERDKVLGDVKSNPPPKTLQKNVLTVGVMLELAAPGGLPPAQATPPQGTTVVAVPVVEALVNPLAVKPKLPVESNAEALGA